MSDFVQHTILPILDQVIDPQSQRSLLSLDAISDIQYVDNAISLSVTLGYPCEEVQQGLSEQLWEQLSALASVSSVDIDFGWRSPANVSIDDQPLLQGVRNIIAVASGKGGVGKSTTTVNLALALAKLGARVGIIDADIYGPSQPTMLGVGVKRPEMRDQNTMIPNENYGIKSMSMGYLVSERTPMVWRGPMATGALQQLIFQSDWGDLDYLFVDMPPGTGDIQLTLSQKVPVSGAVIVTTPQDIALLDAKKALEMFDKVSIPVLGIVENMAVHQCSQCGHKEHIFGEGGGERIAKDYNSTLLGALPLALSIREDADSGKPSVVADPTSEVSQEYISIAQKIATQLWLRQQAAAVPEIMVSED
ncbi:MAG: ATP-binding protein involved in chromosome partitioning [Kiritimatiellia bacterium]|jgi:ATP-binding protein involved in chromosome partitioning